MNHMFDENGHLTPPALNALKTGSLSEIELLLAASHMADCLCCASTFANSFSEYDLIEEFPGFAEEVERKLSSQRKDNRQFLPYSIRVAVSACAALLIVFSGTLNFITDIATKAESLKPPELNFVDSINTELQDFSQKILDMEVFQNETKKK